MRAIIEYFGAFFKQEKKKMKEGQEAWIDSDWPSFVMVNRSNPKMMIMSHLLEEEKENLVKDSVS